MPISIVRRYAAIFMNKSIFKRLSNFTHKLMFCQLLIRYAK